MAEPDTRREPRGRPAGGTAKEDVGNGSEANNVELSPCRMSPLILRTTSRKWQRARPIYVAVHGHRPPSDHALVAPRVRWPCHCDSIATACQCHRLGSQGLLGANPSAAVKPLHGQFERLLIRGSTGHCRPIAAPAPPPISRPLCAGKRALTAEPGSTRFIVEIPIG